MYGFRRGTPMITPKQAARRERIEEAAYAVLRETGYKSASLLAIAKRASASNETLYNWYGNKQTLFRSLIEANAGEARKLLEDALHQARDPLETLNLLGPVLLTLVTGDKAVALNRAAAGDVNDTGTLGQSIAQFGRNTIMPLVGDLLRTASRAGLIACDDPAEAADIYISLLIGDLQVRRIVGVLEELPRAEIEQRSNRAFTLFLRLYAASPCPGGKTAGPFPGRSSHRGTSRP
ncbi:TetR/AcrR family transcriptional regulator [Mesorhizobium sp. B2-4-10]|nr:TetR/AcrR family transcriptional regulator [Mesorhizobium sp. B2-4-11]TPL24602.1 TetR/AcrR family transcriptional regulator [Mesorhizobium sp. B2-4-10]